MKLEPHPFSAMFPPMSKDDFDQLVADIKANGLLQSIMRYQSAILDGNNRYRACQRLGIEPRFEDFTGNDAQAQAYVISANIHRRHLSPEQRREIIAVLIKADPSKSNRQIGETTKASHHTVGDVRGELEGTGQIAQFETTTGADGKKRKRKGGKSKGRKLSHETVSFFEVTNASTALNAYKTLQERLLDALGEVHEYTDLSQAEASGRRTVEMIEEKLGALQPVEADAA